MVRDVSHAVRVRGQARVVASLVLDAGTGLARGIAVGSTAGAACADAMETALTKPAGPLPPEVPGQVLCGHEQAADVTGGLARLLNGAAEPAVTVSTPGAEAEDIFDSFVGHMAGRRQPDEFAGPDDWQLLFAQASDYCQAQPWVRWSDDADMGLVVRIDGAAARYVAVVLGQEGIQRGLVLYPGGALPTGLREWTPGTSVPLPGGTLLFYLDPPEESPPEFVAKAIRYGWPGDADLIPICVASGPDGPADVGRADVHRLTMGLAAVLAHDHSRPTAGNGDLTGNGAGATTGLLTLPGGRRGSYSIG
jgi:hypothetical protein